MNIRLLSLLSTLLFGASMTAFAHHSLEASFDTANPHKISGVVETMIWVDPHVYLLMRGTAAGGTAEPWAVEMSSANVLNRREFNRDTLKPGDEVTITALSQLPGVIVATRFQGLENPELEARLNQVYDRAAAGRLVHGLDITLPDGTTVVSGGGIWTQDLAVPR